MDTEEGLAIRAYKEYAQCYFGDAETLADYQAAHFDPDAYEDTHPSYDTLGRLELYLKDLRKLVKHLVRAAELRQQHFERFLTPESEECGHRKFRKALNKLAADAQGKLLIWERTREEELTEAIERWNALPTPPKVTKSARAPRPAEERKTEKAQKRRMRPPPLSKAQRQRRVREAEQAFYNQYEVDVRRINNELRAAGRHGGLTMEQDPRKVEPWEMWVNFSSGLGLADVNQFYESIRCHYGPFILSCSERKRTRIDTFNLVHSLIMGTHEVRKDQEGPYIFTVCSMMRYLDSQFQIAHNRRMLFEMVAQCIADTTTDRFTGLQIRALTVIGSLLCDMKALTVLQCLSEHPDYRTIIDSFYMSRVQELSWAMLHALKILDEHPSLQLTKPLRMVTNVDRLLDYSYREERKVIRKFSMTMLVPETQWFSQLREFQQKIKSRCV